MFLSKLKRLFSGKPERPLRVFIPSSYDGSECDTEKDIQKDTEERSGHRAIFERAKIDIATCESLLSDLPNYWSNSGNVADALIHLSMAVRGVVRNPGYSRVIKLEKNEKYPNDDTVCFYAKGYRKEDTIDSLRYLYSSAEFSQMRGLIEGHNLTAHRGYVTSGDVEEDRRIAQEHLNALKKLSAMIERECLGGV